MVGFASGRGELATIIATSFWLVQTCAAAMEPVQNCPRNNPCRETNQILFLQVPQGAPFYPDSAKGIMDLVREASWHASEAILYDFLGAAGMAIYHYGEAICALRMLLAAHPGHESQTHLRGAVRQLPVQDRRLGKAHGARPHVGLKLPPPTPVTAGVASISTGIQHRMSVMPWDRRFLP